MKRIKYLIMLVICAALFTGCAIKYETTMEITKEGKVNFAMVQAFDKELLRNLMSIGGEQKEYSDEELKQFLKESLESPDEEGEKSDIELYREKGFTAEEYLEGEFLGYKLSATIEDINKVSSDSDVAFNFVNIDEMPSIQEAKMFKKVDNQYVGHLVFDPNATTANDADEDATGEDSSAGQMDQYMSQISQIYTFTLTLPKAAISNNATTVSEDGKTLTWTLSSTEKTDINFTFELAEKENGQVIEDEGVKTEIPLLWLYIILAIAVVGIIVIVVVMINKDKKEDDELETTQTNIELENQNLSAPKTVIAPMAVETVQSLPTEPKVPVEEPVPTPVKEEIVEEPPVIPAEPKTVIAPMPVEPVQTELETPEEVTATEVEEPEDTNVYGTMTLEEPPVNSDVQTEEKTEPVVTEKAEEPIRNKYCTNCGTKVISGHKFCTNCGEKLK